MIILASASGNHSNRLFQNLHFEAFCKENEIEYINPTFSDMYKYYVSPCNLTKGLKGIYFINRFFAKLVKKIYKNIFSKYFFEFDGKEINDIKSCMYEKDIYVSGWYFRVPDLTEKYQDYFIANYKLKEKYIKSNRFIEKINHLRDAGYLIIGIHIRRGDYKYWQDGKYYFDDGVYLKYMENMALEIERERVKNIFLSYSQTITFQ